MRCCVNAVESLNPSSPRSNKTRASDAGACTESRPYKPNGRSSVPLGTYNSSSANGPLGSDQLSPHYSPSPLAPHDRLSKSRRWVPRRPLRRALCVGRWPRRSIALPPKKYCRVLQGQQTSRRCWNYPPPHQRRDIHGRFRRPHLGLVAASAGRLQMQSKSHFGAHSRFFPDKNQSRQRKELAYSPRFLFNFCCSSNRGTLQQVWSQFIPEARGAL